MRQLARFFCLPLGACLTSMAISDDARAADATSPPAASLQAGVRWDGPYAGAQIGGAWSHQDWEYQNGNFFDTLGPRVVGTDVKLSSTGVIGGVFGGYNYQTGPWVLGLEVSTSGTQQKDSRPSQYFPASDTDTSQINWLATGAARAGYAWDRWLLFGKGGWAGANVDLTLRDRGAQVTANTNTWANGWTIGAGMEYRAWTDVSIGVSYDYLDMRVGDTTMSCGNCGTGVGFGTPVVDGHFRIQSVMLRASYRFGD